MPDIVFITQINPQSPLVWTRRGNGSCLRNFFTVPVHEDRQFTTPQIAHWLGLQGNCQELAPQHDIEDTDFWTFTLNDFSKRHDLPQQVNPHRPYTPPEERPPVGATEANLVQRFKNDVKPLIEESRPVELAQVMESWRQRFVCIKDYKRFNHWDNDDAGNHISLVTGIGWTAQMLESSRLNGETHFIHVENSPKLDFALIAMEVTLGISSYYNLFRLDYTDYVKPDGIGIRRNDSTFCIVEAKGPKDDGDVYEATLQALCGALALHAKRAVYRRIVATNGARRPAFPQCILPDNESSLGLYILVSDQIAVIDPEIDRKMRLIVQACPIVREICHFILDPNSDPHFDRLPLPTVYNRA